LRQKAHRELEVRGTLMYHRQGYADAIRYQPPRARWAHGHGVARHGQMKKIAPTEAAGSILARGWESEMEILAHLLTEEERIC
jgi:hypothetical protein